MVDSTNGIVPGDGSAGSHSSGGNNGAYAESGGGYSAHSGNSPVRTGHSPQSQSLGWSLSIGSRPVNKQYLAPPGRPKRPRTDEPEPEEVYERDGDDEPQHAPAGKQQRGQAKRL
ncbi:hypothetical protein FRC11_005985, partial [Ceratobasidium sp. 423]